MFANRYVCTSQLLGCLMHSANYRHDSSKGKNIIIMPINKYCGKPSNIGMVEKFPGVVSQTIRSFVMECLRA